MVVWLRNQPLKGALLFIRLGFLVLSAAWNRLSLADVGEQQHLDKFKNISGSGIDQLTDL